MYQWLYVPAVKTCNPLLGDFIVLTFLFTRLFALLSTEPIFCLLAVCISQGEMKVNESSRDSADQEYWLIEPTKQK